MGGRRTVVGSCALVAWLSGCQSLLDFTPREIVLSGNDASDTAADSATPDGTAPPVDDAHDGAVTLDASEVVDASACARLGKGVVLCDDFEESLTTIGWSEVSTPGATGTRAVSTDAWTSQALRVALTGRPFAGPESFALRKVAVPNASTDFRLTLSLLWRGAIASTTEILRIELDAAGRYAALRLDGSENLELLQRGPDGEALSVTALQLPRDQPTSVEISFIGGTVYWALSAPTVSFAVSSTTGRFTDLAKNVAPVALVLGVVETQSASTDIAVHYDNVVLSAY